MLSSGGGFIYALHKVWLLFLEAFRFYFCHGAILVVTDPALL